MQHEFDSSLTCNYCGIAAERTKLGETCQKRTRQSVGESVIGTVDQVAPPGSDQDHIRAVQDELAQWQDVGRRLFEYCRWWGLMGAEINATLAVVDLAKLLGKDMQAEAVENAAVESSAATVQMITNWVVESRWINRMSPDKRDQFLKELRGLAEK